MNAERIDRFDDRWFGGSAISEKPVTKRKYDLTLNEEEKKELNSRIDALVESWGK